MLESLSDSLDETYERMLSKIDSHLIDDARRILTFLCFAPRPMFVSQLIDAIAVDIEGYTGLNKKRQLQGSDDIYQICRSFVTIGSGRPSLCSSPENKYSIVRIAHFSIREYLVSKFIHHQNARIFSFDSVTIQAKMAQIYLIYLLEAGSHEPTEEQEFPLAPHAAWSWHYHYKNTMGPVPELDRLIIQLFQRERCFMRWVYLFDEQDEELNLGPTMTPIYWASYLGLTRVLPSLIDGLQDGSMNDSAPSPVIFNQMNADARIWGAALQAASFKGHDQIVHMLLDRGAFVNGPGGFFGDALRAASIAGHVKVVQALLDRGAEVKGKKGEAAVRLASMNQHDEVVQMLLDHGAEVSLTM